MAGKLLLVQFLNQKNEKRGTQSVALKYVNTGGSKTHLKSKT